VGAPGSGARIAAFQGMERRPFILFFAPASM
jgi:hypothetical protein